jgi:MoxR-like ATPase
MFGSREVKALYDAHRETLDLAVALEAELNRRFFRMERAVEGMMLAALTGEPMLMIGPPGTAKSRLIRSFCNLVGLIGTEALGTRGTEGGEEEKAAGYFEYLLTQFTEPSELFGFFDLARLMDAGDRRLVRESAGMMQTAQVVFLDEVFNASSAILNALLTFMNERKFHDRGRILRTPLQLLFSATNHPPRDAALGAVYDRFVLRCRLENVEATPQMLARLVDAAWTETHATPTGGAGGRFRDFLGAMQGFRADVDARTAAGQLRVDAAHPLFADLADVVTRVRASELSRMSNRRLVKLTAAMLARALLEAARAGAAAPEMGPGTLEVVLDFGLDRDDPTTVEKLRQQLRERR